MLAADRIEMAVSEAIMILCSVVMVCVARASSGYHRFIDALFFWSAATSRRCGGYAATEVVGRAAGLTEPYRTLGIWGYSLMWSCN